MFTCLPGMVGLASKTDFLFCCSEINITERIFFSTFLFLTFRLLKIKNISKAEYYFLHRSKCVTSRFYGLPKTYKASVLFRAVVFFFINLPTYNLSKFYLEFYLVC